MLYYSCKDVNMTQLETILLQRRVLGVCQPLNNQRPFDCVPVIIRICFLITDNLNLQTGNGSRAQTNMYTNGWPKGRYQVNYLPRFAVGKYCCDPTGLL